MKVDPRQNPQKRSMSGSDNTPPAIWNEFNAAEEWIGGVVLWLWAPSWAAARLAIAMLAEPGNWEYESGAKVGAGGEQFPTHCSYPVLPVAGQ